MEVNKRLHSVALVSASLILFLIIVSSTASATTAQGVSSLKTYAYAANWDANNVSVIDTTTNKVIATVDVEDSPDGVTITPDGKRVYGRTTTATVSL